MDLLHVPGPIAPEKIDRVPPFLAGEQSAMARDYLREVIARGQLFTRQTYLTRSLVDLELSLALVSRFARASALGHGRPEVTRTDVLEGCGITDLLITHRSDRTASTVLDNLRLMLMSDPTAFRRFLANES